MGQISITSLPGVAAAGPTQGASATAERVRNRFLAAAVRTVNETGHPGDGREVTFSVDQATRQPVIRVVDINTRQVVDQWPPEYLLQLAAGSTNTTRDSG